MYALWINGLKALTSTGKRNMIYKTNNNQATLDETRKRNLSAGRTRNSSGIYTSPHTKGNNKMRLKTDQMFGLFGSCHPKNPVSHLPGSQKVISGAGILLFLFIGFTTVFGQFVTFTSKEQKNDPSSQSNISSYENINLFNGDMNFRIPLASVGGRGSLNNNISLSINQKWEVHTKAQLPQSNPYITTNIDLPGSPEGWDVTFTNQIYTPRERIKKFSPYGLGNVIGRRTGSGIQPTQYWDDINNVWRPICNPSSNSPLLEQTITKLSFVMSDGSEIELRDSLTEGKPAVVTQCQQTVPSRGTVFKSYDGTGITFISDTTIDDYIMSSMPGNTREFKPTGYLMTGDGSKSRVENGEIVWMQDVNGNRTTKTATTGNIVYTDSLSRNTEVILANQTNNLTDEIKSPGIGGTTRSSKVYYQSLGDTLQTGQTLKSYAALFPELYGASSTGTYNPRRISKIELPNGNSFEFLYNSYGELAKVKMPTGSIIEYIWGSEDFVNMGQVFRVLKERKVYKAAGVLENTTTYQRGVNSAEGGFIVEVTVKNAANVMEGKSVHYFNGSPTEPTDIFVVSYQGWFEGKEYKTETYDAGGQLRQRVETEYEKPLNVPWTASSSIYSNSIEYLSRVKSVKTTIFEGAQSLTNKVSYGYQIANLLNLKTDEWISDFGAGNTEGRILKHTQTGFLNDSNYTNNYLFGLPVTSKLFDVQPDNSEVLVAQSETRYDEAAYPVLNVGTDTGWFDPNTAIRGNATTARVWNNTDNSWIETHAQFDNFGNARKAWDAKGNLSEVEFSSTYKYAFPTKTISSVPDPTGANGSSTAFETTSVYDLSTGLVTSATDANGQTSTMEYNDALLRPTKVIPPTGGAQTVMEYTDTPGAMKVVTKTQIDATNWAESTVYADGLGRAVKTEKKDAAGNVFAETEYDSMGRVKKATNPYRTGETKLWTENTYDDLSRITKVKTPDNAEVTTAYAISTSGTLGTVVTVTDQAGKKRRSLTNGLGQLVRVDEPNDAGSLGTITSPVQSTAYSYDTLNNLVTVNQGAQTRTFQYDSLSRLKQATNPESGTISYAYDANGNLTGKTDARSITTTYAYDNLNRVKTRSYSDSTPAVAYNYDGTGLGSVPSYAKGKLTKVSSSVSETKYDSFDNLGKILSSSQLTDGQTYNFGYAYNLAGMLTEETYPSGRKVKNTIATDASLSKVETQPSGGSYATRADNFVYTAAGAVSAMQLGNAKWENAQFNSRLQPTQLGLGTSATDQSLWKVAYDYGTTDNNGNVKQQTISVPSITPLEQTYAYDSLNRIKSAVETQSSAQTWKQTFTYDRYGNRNFDAANTTTLGSCSTNQCNPTIDAANNRFTTNQGYTYDLSGNLLTDAQNRSFVYDAENKQKTVSDASGTIGTYSYDGDGKRVKKVSASENTIFVYDASGKMIAEYLLTTATPQTATTSYLTSDTLGSPRVITDTAGNVTSRRDFMPFGEEISGLGNRTSANGYQVDSTRQKFTTYERDAETDLDFAQARIYNNKLGRFTSADPLLASGKAPNPQTWNRYNYVGNNPINLIDPLGLDWYYNKESRSYRWSADGKTFKDGSEVGSGWTSVVGNNGEGGSFSYQGENGNWVALDPYSANFQENIASRDDAIKLAGRLYDLTPDIREFAAGYNKNYDRNINIVTAMAAASGIVIAAPYVATAIIGSSAPVTLGLVEGGGSSGTALINGNVLVGEAHLSITTRLGAERVATQMTARGVQDAMVVDNAVASSNAINLPNAQAAMNLQRNLLDGVIKSGRYARWTNNCVTHCADVLKAGGLSSTRANYEVYKMYVQTWLKSQ